MHWPTDLLTGWTGFSANIWTAASLSLGSGDDSDWSSLCRFRFISSGAESLPGGKREEEEEETHLPRVTSSSLCSLHSMVILKENPSGERRRGERGGTCGTASSSSPAFYSLILSSLSSSSSSSGPYEETSWENTAWRWTNFSGKNRRKKRLHRV